MTSQWPWRGPRASPGGHRQAGRCPALRRPGVQPRPHLGVGIPSGRAWWTCWVGSRHSRLRARISAEAWQRHRRGTTFVAVLTTGGGCAAAAARRRRDWTGPLGGSLLTPQAAHLPESGRSAPEALEAGSDKGAVKSVPPPPPLPAHKRPAYLRQCLRIPHRWCMILQPRARATRMRGIACDAHENGRVGSAKVQRLSVPRRSVAAVGALRCRCILCVVPWRTARRARMRGELYRRRTAAARWDDQSRPGAR